MVRDRSACAWCLHGAIHEAYGLFPHEDTERTLNYKVAADAACGMRDAAIWNDLKSRTQAEVVALAEKVEAELGI